MGIGVGRGVGVGLVIGPVVDGVGMSGVIGCNNECGVR